MRAMVLAPLAVFVSFGSVPQVSAATIDYVFDGVGTGSLGASAFSGSFEVSVVSDTSSVTGGPDYRNFGNGFFKSGALTATFMPGDIGLQELQTNSFVGFIQYQPAPVYAVSEGIDGSAFATYNLKTSLPDTSGSVSFSPQTYITEAGNLTFNGISSLSFEASVSAVPLPPALPMFGAALVGLAFAGYRMRRRGERGTHPYGSDAPN